MHFLQEELCASRKEENYATGPKTQSACTFTKKQELTDVFGYSLKILVAVWKARLNLYKKYDALWVNKIHLKALKKSYPPQANLAE